MSRIANRWWLGLYVVAVLASQARAASGDDLIASLAGTDEQARSLARQRLPREGVQVVPRLLPLLRDKNPAVREAAFQVLSDLANEAAAPGRGADRAAVTTQVMSLLQSDQPAEIKRRGLRLISIVIPTEGDVGTVAALLDDPALREPAREALEEIGTAPGRVALRNFLPKADPDFTCALLNSLGRLRDRDSIEVIATMTRSGNSKVRAAAARALAWTGDPGQVTAVRAVVAAADSATKADALDAQLRLLNAMARERDHRPAAAAGYLELLGSATGQVKDGALAGLGRLGDAAAAPVILQAIREAEPPTLGVGMAALRAIPGEDVTRALVEAFPKFPPRTQAAMIPVLGSRHDPAVLSILEQAARSDEPGRRVVALEAIGDTGLDRAMEILKAEAERGDEASRARARAVLAASSARVMAQRRERLGSGPVHETDLLGLLGIVGRWWVVGPFDLGQNNEGWTANTISEPKVNVVARYMAGKTRRQWKPVVSQDSNGKIDLRATLAETDNCIGYAYAEIEVEKPTDAVLLLGVDDSEKVWVNGNKVLEQFMARPLQVDQDKVPVKLKAGTNTILLKIYQNSQGWEFCARLTTPDGQPVAFKQKAE